MGSCEADRCAPNRLLGTGEYRQAQLPKLDSAPLNFSAATSYDAESAIPRPRREAPTTYVAKCSS